MTSSTYLSRKPIASVAGFTFLFYIAVGLPYGLDAHISVLMGLLSNLSALVLAVMLYALTREQNQEVALLGLTCRVAEGVLGSIFISARLALLSLGTTANAPDPLALQVLSAFVGSARGWNTIVGATFFAVGSLLFCWLLLRGRTIPVPLAWLGVLASLILVVGLPLQLAGILSGTITQLLWLPMALFEIPLGIWLLIKGVAVPASNTVALRANLPA